jgi:UPF0755 protein
MNDHLIFGREPGETGDVDVDELKAALAAGPDDELHEPAAVAPEPTPEERARTARRRHRTWLVFAVVVLLVIVAGLVGAFMVWKSGTEEVPDYAGTGDTEVVVRIQGGDGIKDIAQTLVTAGVVASTTAFEQQAALDGDVQALKPGYYKVRQNSSAQAAADALVAKENHVGHLRLIPGRQLADVTAVTTGGTQSVVPGYISDIATAACVPLNGQQDCFTADDLWQVATTADPATLGVVEWAAEGVRASPDPRNRLEGTIMPGDFDIPPGSTPEQALKAVVSASAAMWNGTDIIADAARLGITPYQAATIASIVEREGTIAEMPKVSRVIYNRLAAGMKLQLDSTVNYALDKAAIATTATERANPSPWNTYIAPALPPTPISAPGPDAIAATLDPAAGSWLFFVIVDNNGQFCFSITVEQHDACVAQARANGVFG